MSRSLEPVLTPAQLQDLLASAFPGADVPRVTDVTETGCRVRLMGHERHGRPGGTVSGPAMMTLADTAAWMAILSRIGPVVLAVTTSLHIDFLRKPSIGDVVADAELLKLGSRLAVVNVRLYSEDTPEVVAAAQVTYSLPPS